MAMTYDEVVRRLGRRPSIKVDKRRGTEIRWAPGDVGDVEVRHRGVSVVTFHADRTYTLRTGPTASKTVLRRIAEYSPVALVRRGNGLFLEQDGRLVPFLSGIRVDAAGRIATSRGAELTLPLASGAEGQTLDAVRFKDYVRQIVQDIWAEQATPTDLARVTPAVRATATVTAQPFDSWDAFEGLIASLPAGDARRHLEEYHAARTRGRRPLPAPINGDDAGTPAAVRCPECGRPIVEHYDRANRPRGCDYALRRVPDRESTKHE
jgi:hypothetical protein